MFVKTVVRGFLIWLATLACDVSQPLPPPQLPASQRLGCRVTGCADGDVCHPAIGAGTCAAPCGDDTACAALGNGFVCHPDGTCAPACTSDLQCGSISNGTGCQMGRCVQLPAPTHATVRLFNATSGHDVRVMRAGAELLATLASGQLSEPLQVGAGDANLTFGDPALATFTGVNLLAGRSYVIVFWQHADAFRVTGVQLSTAVPPASDRAVVAFVNLGVALYNQAVAVEDVVQLRVGDTLLYGSVGRGVVRTNAEVPTGTLPLRVEAIERPVLAAGQGSFQGGKRYVVVFTRSLGQAPPERRPIAQTLIIGEDGTVERFSSAALRLVNAVEDSDAVRMFVDEKPFEEVGKKQTTTPADGFFVVAAGEHRIDITYPPQMSGGVPVATGFTGALSEGETYSMTVGGNVASGTIHTQFYSETPPAGQTQVRALHYCVSHATTPMDLRRDPGTAVASGVAFGQTATGITDHADQVTFTATFGGTGALTSAVESFSSEESVTLVCTGNKLWVLTERGARPYP